MKRTKTHDALNLLRVTSTPIVQVQTFDPIAFCGEDALSLWVNVKLDSTPQISVWDVVEKLRPIVINDAAPKYTDSQNASSAIRNWVSYWSKTDAKMPEQGVILLLHMAHKFMEPMLMQALLNAREWCSNNSSMIVMLTTPGFNLPPEIQQSVSVVKDELPERSAILEIILGALETNKIDPESLQEQQIVAAVDASRGLTPFAIAQASYLAMRGGKLDLGVMNRTRESMIDGTPGLSVVPPKFKFSDVGGCNNIKQFLSRVAAGTPPSVVVFIDEIEKALAGSGGQDTSGVSREMLGGLLNFMQQHEIRGSLLLGPPGCAKSMVAQAWGGECDVPTVAMNLSDMKGGIVGQSTQNLSRALSIVEAIGGTQSVWVATCNSIGSLPVELRRRFKLGTFFFDMPDDAERSVIWQLYQKKYKLPDCDYATLFDKFTGAEISNACTLAHQTQMSIEEAVRFICPVWISASQEIDELRNAASGRYISASYEGVYNSTRTMTQTQTRLGKRRLA